MLPLTIILKTIAITTKTVVHVLINMKTLAVYDTCTCSIRT